MIQKVELEVQFIKYKNVVLRKILSHGLWKKRRRISAPDRVFSAENLWRDGCQKSSEGYKSIQVTKLTAT